MMLEALVKRSGLEAMFDAVLSVDAVRAFKTHPDVYQYALDSLDLPASAISFQSSNAWDAHGASDFGMRVVWCNRYGQRRERLPGSPDFEIRTLAELPALLGRAPVLSGPSPASAKSKSRNRVVTRVNVGLNHREGAMRGKSWGRSLVDLLLHGTEWSGSVVALEELPDAVSSEALSINGVGQAVRGQLYRRLNPHRRMDRRQHSRSRRPAGLHVQSSKRHHNAGQVAGVSIVDGVDYAIDGTIINLGALAPSTFSEANGINDVGQVAREFAPPSTPVPEASTWVMMLVGFAGFAFVGHRSAKAGRATLASYSRC